MLLAVFPAAVAWWILKAFMLFLAGVIVVGVCVLVKDVCSGVFRGSRRDDDGL